MKVKQSTCLLIKQLVYSSTNQITVFVYNFRKTDSLLLIFRLYLHSLCGKALWVCKLGECRWDGLPSLTFTATIRHYKRLLLGLSDATSWRVRCYFLGGQKLLLGNEGSALLSLTRRILYFRHN